MLKSKAAIFISKKQGIIIDDIYLTEPNDTEVIIKNFYTGLCGSILTNLS
jgi:Zn-dependent alcohol dehydrogenase